MAQPQPAGHWVLDMHEAPQAPVLLKQFAAPSTVVPQKQDMPVVPRQP